MTKIRNLYRNHPLIGSVILTVFFALCMAFFGWMGRQLPFYPQKILDMLWPVGLVLLMGYGFIFRQKGFFATLIPGMALVCLGFTLIGFNIFRVIYYKQQFEALPVIIKGIVFVIGIGIREEVVFRGVIGNALALKYGTSNKGVWLATILAAAMFSLMHLQNLRAGIEPMAMTAQLISTFGVGLVFVAFYLRGGNIWVAILIHALVDAGGLFDSTFVQTTATAIDDMNQLEPGYMLIQVSAMIVLTLFLLRKSKRPAILARLEKLRAEIQY